MNRLVFALFQLLFLGNRELETMNLCHTIRLGTKGVRSYFALGASFYAGCTCWFLLSKLVRIPSGTNQNTFGTPSSSLPELKLALNSPFEMVPAT